jgi:hypothetical protein
MQYPEHMTAEDIREFEFEMNARIDADRQDYMAEVELDDDEPKGPITGCDPAEYNDDWYDEQFEVDFD